ncbi:hypothetical protein [Pseudomonas simiae]|jgi:hypothetical protein|uniref:Uncharacterized protein n=1 Tax=Pseudomonas simiae TaxID=321846 RepID=A0ABS9G958_9PSED|nr:hypothetical protein [Pseudomonas simiae]MBI6614247.1 hypothetical protein [Pseudomonas simiae]MCF5189858.1 hypothetical protein [Pseudomonas simiae]MCF5286904.1 hypothetical protein [Pseudomonas simiae]MCF5319950.1 hypothetical protein [Pseudomonas simiae]MCF5336844.1 hypothetical protein [Pseudomonas simiae]
MSHGLTFNNNSDVVTLDSEFARLVVIHKGIYGPAGGDFPSVITSQEPPLIFVRPSTGGFQWVSLKGSPGNWTGFINGASGGSGSFFVAAYESAPTAKYGLRLWDGDAKQLFDNGTPCAQFTDVVAGWAYGGASNPSVGRWISTFYAAVPLNTGNYMLINNIAMNIPGGSTFSLLSCFWDYANNRVVAQLQNIGDFNGSSFFLPLMFAKPIS